MNVLYSFVPTRNYTKCSLKDSNYTGGLTGIKLVKFAWKIHYFSTDISVFKYVRICPCPWMWGREEQKKEKEKEAKLYLRLMASYT